MKKVEADVNVSFLLVKFEASSLDHKRKRSNKKVSLKRVLNYFPFLLNFLSHFSVVLFHLASFFMYLLIHIILIYFILYFLIIFK